MSKSKNKSCGCCGDITGTWIDGPAGFWLLYMIIVGIYLYSIDASLQTVILSIIEVIVLFVLILFMRSFIKKNKKSNNKGE